MSKAGGLGVKVVHSRRENDASGACSQFDVKGCQISYLSSAGACLALMGENDEA